MSEAFTTRFEGRCWKFGDNIPTDALVKSRYVFDPMAEIVAHVLEDQNPRFPAEVQPGDIVVAGKHFGQSSGRAIATKALKATGIGCVVAETFSRTFFRNCFEVALPSLEVEGVSDLVEDGDHVIVDIAQGYFRNETRSIERRAAPAAPFLLRMLAVGGLIALTQSDPNWAASTVEPDSPVTSSGSWGWPDAAHQRVAPEQLASNLDGKGLPVEDLPGETGTDMYTTDRE
ncbi:LeuD/DmdB family oxidoreductase small subunit [Subtercola sp. YIM 133946]|uniref:LeuD/DmdB family oxidoreductase small subunit n=1 Tax=Subtercola sp. YIM 133946 TaxID=3118909 RepID=UPI002F91CA1D